MTTSVLATAAWWRVLLERLGRQAAQTAAPIIVAIVVAGGDVNVASVSLGLGLSLALTLVKFIVQSLADVTPAEDEPMAWHLLDRAVPAFAGTLLGLIPVGVDGLDSFQWEPALVAASSAAILAILAMYATPPAIAPVPEAVQ